MNSKPIGITFSHRHLEYLKLDVEPALAKALTLNFSHLRLGCYWSEIEPAKNNYNFSKINQLLEKCEVANQPVILTIGVKAPRWPEFYWPEHIKEKNFTHLVTQQKIINFLEKIVEKLKKYQCITYWQVENEPLDPSGPSNLVIPLSFLKKEIELVKNLDHRKVLINFWGNDLLTRKLIYKIEDQADLIGLDLYPKQFVKKILGKNIYKNYFGFHQPKNKLLNTLKNINQKIIITELQAEPWEDNEQEYLSKNPASISPTKLEQNILAALELPIEEILLWGFEYWWWQKKQNNNSDYFKVVEKFL
ncbi:MAG: endo-1,4-beta-xylanase [Patescibacteria group bacterium]